MADFKEDIDSILGPELSEKLKRRPAWDARGNAEQQPESAPARDGSASPEQRDGLQRRSPALASLLADMDKASAGPKPPVGDSDASQPSPGLAPAGAAPAQSAGGSPATGPQGLGAGPSPQSSSPNPVLAPPGGLSTPSKRVTAASEEASPPDDAGGMPELPGFDTLRAEPEAGAEKAPSSGGAAGSPGDEASDWAQFATRVDMRPPLEIMKAAAQGGIPVPPVPPVPAVPPPPDSLDCGEDDEGPCERDPSEDSDDGAWTAGVSADQGSPGRLARLAAGVDIEDAPTEEQVLELKDERAPEPKEKRELEPFPREEVVAAWRALCAYGLQLPTPLKLLGLGGVLVVAGGFIALVVLVGGRVGGSSPLPPLYVSELASMRIAPGTGRGFTEVASLERGEPVQRLDGADASVGGFVLVRDSTGRVGFVLRDGLQEDAPDVTPDAPFVRCTRRPVESGAAPCVRRATVQLDACIRGCSGDEADLAECESACEARRDACAATCVEPPEIPVATPDGGFGQEAASRTVTSEDLDDPRTGQAIQDASGSPRKGRKRKQRRRRNARKRRVSGWGP